MNKKFRKFLLSLLAVIFIFSSVSGIIYATQKHNIIKTIKKNIHVNDFIKYLNREKENYYNTSLKDQKEVDFDFLSSQEFKQNALNKLLYSTLIENDIEYYNIEEPLNVVAKKIVNEKQFQNNKDKFDNIKFMQFLEEIKLTEKQFLDIIRRDDERIFLSLIFNQPFFVPELTINKFYDYHNSQKEIYIFKKNINKFIIKDKLITEEEIKKYYEFNKNNFIVKEQKLIEYLEFSKLSQEEIEKLSDEIMLANNLEEIEKKFNVKKKSLGFKNYEELMKINFINLEELNTMKNGDLSNIVNVDNKFYVYSVVNTKEEYTKSLEEVKNKIINIIKLDNSKEAAIEATNKLLKDNNKQKINFELFTNNNYTFEKMTVNKNSKNIDEHLLNKLLLLKDGEYTNIFDNGEEIMFAVVLKSSILKEGEKDYISKNDIKDNLFKSFNNSIQENYYTYLRKNKYKAKIDYKLFKLVL